MWDMRAGRAAIRATKLTFPATCEPALSTVGGPQTFFQMPARLTWRWGDPPLTPPAGASDVVVTLLSTRPSPAWLAGGAGVRRLKVVAPTAAVSLAPLAAATRLKFLEVDALGCDDALPVPARACLTSAWLRTHDAAACARALSGGCPSLTKLALVAADPARAPPVCLLALADALHPCPRLGRLALDARLDAPRGPDSAALARCVRSALPRVRVLPRDGVTPTAAAVLQALE